MISALINVIFSVLLIVFLVIVYILLLVLLFIASVIMLPGFERLRYEAKELIAPFPAPGSWSYRIQTWWYDLRAGGHTSGDFSIDPNQPNNLSSWEDEDPDIIIRNPIMSRSNPSGEADSNEDNADDSILDQPAYLRRDASTRDILPDSDAESGSSDNGDPKPPSIRTNFDGHDI